MTSEISDVLRRELTDIVQLTDTTDGFRVTTHCLYPSNGLVSVLVQFGKRTAVVSDNGGALGEALSAGIDMRPTDRRLARVVSHQGLEIRNGVIFAPAVPLDQTAFAVLLVANAAKEVAHWLYDTAKFEYKRDFRKALSSFLVERFKTKLSHDVEIRGAYKPHRFTNVITFRSGARLVVDPVLHEAPSINSRVVAHLDLKEADDPLIQQRIVYDDEETWPAADLNLLQMGAPTVAFSQATGVINRIAELAEQANQ